jgi:hypothetical protein
MISLGITRRRCVVGATVFSASVLAPAVCIASNFPDKAITLISASAPRESTDIIVGSITTFGVGSRVILERASSPLNPNLPFPRHCQ